MSKTLVTFSGKYGDILWSLATVKRLAELRGEAVDFACMPQYESLTELINAQAYIQNAYVLTDWQMLHSNFGDQPWNPPGHNNCLVDPHHKCTAGKGYDYCYHLGYRQHPGRVMGGQEMQLIDFTAWQQGIRFAENPIPFLTAPTPETWKLHQHPYVAVAFNEQYKELKDRFMDVLFPAVGGFDMINVSKLPWADAAYVIRHAVAFVGCRSANWVIACGLGQRSFTYEPHPARHRAGHLGYVFGCNYACEVTSTINGPPEQEAGIAANVLRQWIKQTEEEQNAVTQTITG